MKMIRMATAALLMLTNAAAIAQTAPAPATAAKPAKVAERDADPALWVVKDADTTIYLFGTVHILKPGLSWFDEAVRKAFDASQQVVFEIPLEDDATAQSVILPLALAPAGPSLTDKLHADKRALYATVLGKVGLPAAALDRYAPWFAAVTLSQLQLRKAGYDPQSGAERAINAAAKAAGKPVTGLETLKQQLGYFADLPERDQIAFLELGIADFDDGPKQIDTMVADWAKGDPDALARVMNRDIDKLPLLYKVLLKDRNARWADWIDARMKQPGTVFVAVGAGHLAGKDSVQRMLARHRLKAVRIRY